MSSKTARQSYVSPPSPASRMTVGVPVPLQVRLRARLPGMETRRLSFRYAAYQAAWGDSAAGGDGSAAAAVASASTTADAQRDLRLRIMAVFPLPRDEA